MRMMTFAFSVLMIAMCFTLPNTSFACHGGDGIHCKIGDVSVVAMSADDCKKLNGEPSAMQGKEGCDCKDCKHKKGKCNKKKGKCKKCHKGGHGTHPHHSDMGGQTAPHAGADGADAAAVMKDATSAP